LISKSGSLTDFFASVIGNYGSHIRDFALVVILDQFEELFTRFVDPGIIRTRTSSQALDWKLRREFFNQYGSLFEYRIPSDNPEIPVGDHLPIRYVISMRDDFLAQLEDLRKIVGPLEDNMYHLNMLEPGDATDALREPARQFGYDYSENCVNRIVSDLTREERFVEPAHLSIVCSRLWDAYGRKISEGSYTGQADIDKLIHEAEFAELGGAAGIISSFFKSFLTGLNMDERLETVELLSRLITGAGTRNIVEQSALVNAPYRDCERRRMLLDNLIKNHGIVRAEYRFGGRFISITHEFLIEPIQEAEHELLASNIEYGQFQWALEMLGRAASMVSKDPIASLLPMEAFTLLDRRYSEVVWDNDSIEAMFRTAIARQKDKAILRFWSEKYKTTVAESNLSDLKLTTYQNQMESVSK
jgi:hypothetical protein